MSKSIETITTSFSHEVRCLIRPPLGPEQEKVPVLIALHGQGMSASLSLRILRHLDAERMLLVVPEGVYPFEIRKKKTMEIGYAWYLYRGEQEEFLHHLKRGEEYLLSLYDELERRYSIDRARSVLLGFSQGGYLAGFIGLRQRKRTRTCANF